jgi:hypothetical protein
MTPNEFTGTRNSARAPVQTAALSCGVLSALIGAAGFTPGLTSHLDALMSAGHHSQSMLLGLFAVSVLHNAVHLAFGVAGVLASRQFGLSRTFLIGGGAVYAVLCLYGLLIDRGTPLEFVPLNAGDNWLHLGLAVVVMSLGALPGRYVIHTGTGAMGTHEAAKFDDRDQQPGDSRRLCAMTWPNFLG